MKVFRGFAIVSVALTLALAILGSWVRINNAGMTCPDWPLCNGAVVPSMANGVVFEWSHRLLAFVLSFVLAGLAWSAWRVRDRIAGIRPALGALGAIFAVQVLLGAATVHLSNSPVSVVLHWATAMLLLATLAAIAVLATLRPEPGRASAFGDGPGPALAVATGLALVAMCAGAYVSSSYAGLACTTFPTCDGTLLGHGDGGQLAQMLHRFAAGAFALAATIATIVASQIGSARVRAFALAGFALLGIQIALGAANVLGGLPMLLREAHAANAALTFVAYAIATICAAAAPLRAPAPASDRAPAARRATAR